MISAAECRERAAECRQMAERAPTLRVRSILTDMAWTWTRLALEAEQLNPKSARTLQPLVQPSSFPDGPPSGD